MLLTYSIYKTTNNKVFPILTNNKKYKHKGVTNSSLFTKQQERICFLYFMISKNVRSNI